jgi:hypothetical protein
MLKKEKLKEEEEEEGGHNLRWSLQREREWRSVCGAIRHSHIYCLNLKNNGVLSVDL